MIDITKLKEDVTKGIENFRTKHSMTNYQIQKLAGLPGKTMDTVEESGGITIKTLYKMGRGVGYKGAEFNVVIRVLKDMAGK